MKKLWMMLAGMAVVLLSGNAGAVLPRQARPPAPATAVPAVAVPQAILDQYCITCHNQRAKTADLMLDTMDVERVGKDAAVWERVVRKVRTGMMPPAGAKRPERTALDAFAAELETRLDRAAAANPNPGSPS